MLIIWAMIHLNGQNSTSKKIGFSNYNIDRVQTSPQVGKQINNGKLIINIPKGAPAPKVTLDLFVGDSTLDLTSNDRIHIKLKSEYGTFIRVFPIDADGFTLPDTGALSRQKVRCASAFQWSQHDLVKDTLTNGAPLNNLKRLGIAPDFGTGPVTDVVLEIDSILLGAVDYTPTLPSLDVPEGKVWALNNLDGIYSFGANTTEVVTEGLRLEYKEQSASNKGIQFKIKSSYGDDDYINMSNYPFLVVSFKGASNDTLRANLVTSPNNSIIPNQAFKKIDGEGTTSISFSHLTSLYSFDKISEIQLFLNDNNSSSGTLILTALEAGMGMPMENCSGAIGIFDTKISSHQTTVYPNPVAANQLLEVGTSYKVVSFSNIDGTEVNALAVESGHVSIPSSLKPGLYLLRLTGVDGVFYSKLQITD